jgi:RND family efflux transporter MFP subunit
MLKLCSPWLIALGMAWSFAALASGQDLQIPAALVKLIDQQDVPAREPGNILSLAGEEGFAAQVGTLLVQLDDTEARLAQQRAKVELAIAEHAAASNVELRAAERTYQSAAADLRRAEDARDRLRETVTETELERLRLAADQAKLAIEKNREAQAVAALTRDLKKVEVAAADRQLARHHVLAPFSGVVVQIYKRPGEWAEAGEKVVRLIRLDRLRVEGFLDAALASQNLENRPVKLTIDLPGKPGAVFTGTVKFVSPEIDPFNRSVRVLAEIENPSLTLQPGLRGTLTIASP